MLPPKVMGPRALCSVFIYSLMSSFPSSALSSGHRLWCLSVLLCFACEFMDFSRLKKKKIKVSVMHFHLSTLMFFPDGNWCCLAGGIWESGTETRLFLPVLHGIIGSSDRSLKIEWIDKSYEKDEEREKKMKPWAVTFWCHLLTWACFQFIAGNSSKRSNSISAFIKAKVKGNAKVCLPS